MSLPQYQPNTAIDPRALKATQRYRETWALLTDRSYWPVKIFVATNLFLWHLKAFEKTQDPVPLFVDIFDRATKLLKAAKDSGVCGELFPPLTNETLNGRNFEKRVSGLFSDVWVEMTDDIYFDQTYAFTKERFEKNDIDPNAFFKDKVVLDAGCGSGKFTAAIAKLGAKKAIGLDIGEKGLEFARKQAQKVPYGDRLEFRHGSLLEIPFENESIDLVWSNGVIHHTLNYEKCISEFARVLKKDGTLFLYVNGRFGLYELLQDTMRMTMAEVPRNLTQHFLVLLGNNAGRVYWVMDHLHAPYEWKSKTEVVEMLRKYGFEEIRQLMRGVSTDQIEQISTGLPYAGVKYGEGQLKFVAKKKGS